MSQGAIARYAALADRLLRQFSLPPTVKDPKVFIASVMTVMTYYPLEIIEQIVDPFFGLASRQNRIPTPYDVRKMADELMAPALQARERAAIDAAVNRRARESAAEAAEIAKNRKSRQTLEEIGYDLAQRGVYLPSYVAAHPERFGPGGKPHAETAATACAKFSLTPAQWDALPNAPPRAPPSRRDPPPGYNTSEGAIWQRIGAAIPKRAGGRDDR